mmetsp:Transcript_12130/g.27342  ORF Transcript_12130/g.27342 Transcript_12130/m.27342 type:complete len:320 (-) Transcript_12130:361-1320(-)
MGPAPLVEPSLRAPACCYRSNNTTSNSNSSNHNNNTRVGGHSRRGAREDPGRVHRFHARVLRARGHPLLPNDDRRHRLCRSVPRGGNLLCQLRLPETDDVSGDGRPRKHRGALPPRDDRLHRPGPGRLVLVGKSVGETPGPDLDRRRVVRPDRPVAGAGDDEDDEPRRGGRRRHGRPPGGERLDALLRELPGPRPVLCQRPPVADLSGPETRRRHGGTPRRAGGDSERVLGTRKQEPRPGEKEGGQQQQQPQVDERRRNTGCVLMVAMAGLSVVERGTPKPRCIAWESGRSRDIGEGCLEEKYRDGCGFVHREPLRSTL